MPLPAGTRIGGYEVVGLIGAGGMGEVYRARDARLGRDVAIKIVSARIASDPRALIRFEREARMLASLNHPNIAAIYGVEDGAGAPALILELVDGETLADRIAHGPVPVPQVLDYARQIADALDAAHEAGIVHRDLKPANIKITPAGAIKVLDFGLAKAIAAASHDPAVDPSQSPTITIEGTQRGVILGTAAYMSPEQARGKTIDKRTDIWAFGCVLYELLAGQRAYDGETTSDVIAAILERQPDLARLPASVPPHVRRVIARCLEKDPKRRARDIADVRVALEPGEEVSGSGAVPPSTRRVPAVAAIAALAAVLVAGYVGSAWPFRRPAAPERPVEFSFGPPVGTFTPLTPVPSPDGKRLAFVVRDAGRTSLWVRSTDAMEPRRIEGTDGVTGKVFWAPDGRSLGFFAAGNLKRVPADGGPIVTLASGLVNLGASWNQGDVIILAPANRASLVKVPASGGTPVPLTRLDPATENSHRWPDFLPDGRHFLFTVRSDKPENQGIKIGSLDSPEVKTLINVGSPAIYVEPGLILYVTPDGVLMAQPFDPSTLTISGTPRPVAAGVRYVGPSADAAIGASRDGSVLAYLTMPRGASKLVWFDRSGRNLGTVGPERRYGDIRLSPDGRRAAVFIPDERTGTRDVWFVETLTHALTRVTVDPATDWRPVWSPDGTGLVFASDRMGLSSVFRLSITLDGRDAMIYRTSKGGAFPADWSREGRLLIQHDDENGRPTTVSSVRPDGSDSTPIVEGTARVNLARFSPESDRISFNSDATGSFEVYVMSLTDRSRTRVSTAGGINAMWGRDGRELFYVNPEGEVMLASITHSGALAASAPVRLFTPCQSQPGAAAFSPSVTEVRIDVAADGTRFLAICDSADTIPASAAVAVHWQNRLR